jgi:hypothetical protein
MSDAHKRTPIAIKAGALPNSQPPTPDDVVGDAQACALIRVIASSILCDSATQSIGDHGTIVVERLLLKSTSANEKTPA